MYTYNGYFSFPLFFKGKELDHKFYQNIVKFESPSAGGLKSSGADALAVYEKMPEPGPYTKRRLA